ncbi:MAG TPA: hypothetical protein VL095_08970 [Flavisolibacter sp.]|nr:hypothetical protein [Flavisolibacter sp.]
MKLLIYLLIISVGCCSCFHVYYAPNSAHAPLLSEKGETRINGLYSTGGNSEFNGGELQFAHAVSQNFGIMVNGMMASKSEQIDDWGFSSNWGGSSNYHTEKGSGSYLELAGGYFKTFDEKKKWIGELYSGLGAGGVKNDYGFGDYSKVNSYKFFIQPAVGYKSKYFEAMIVPKVSFINWKVKERNIQTSGNNSYAEADISAIGAKRNFLAFEPALLFRAGGQNVKLQWGLSFSGFNSSSFYDEDLIETLNANIGISVNLKPRRK